MSGHELNESRRTRRAAHASALLAAVCVAMLMAAGDGARANTPRFYPDDPIARDPETEDASMVQAWDVSDSFDFFENSFGTAGDRTPRRAMNLNTLDEVPDSSWFTNRLGMRPMTLEELVRGPDTGTGPAPGKLTVISGKNEGISPGMTIRDSLGQVYFVKFDPPTNPEMATGAEVISTKIFHAFGYHVPENYIATLRPSDLVIEPGAQVTRPDGHVHNVQQRDLDELFRRVAQKSDGSYRLVASRAVAGKPLGPFRYHGTRSDDPNDIFPHEHRRELRGMRVLAAWVNHDEWRSSNSFDALVDIGGRRIVKHHLLDFGSTLGSGSIAAQSRRPGNEYVWERRPTLLTMLTLGLYVRPWLKVKYPDLPAAGRIESDYFQPAMWKPDYPNPAYENARADDLFWAARRVAAFSDDAIRALVRIGRIHRPGSHRLPHRCADRAPRQGLPALAQSAESARGFLSRLGRLAELSECRRRRRGGHSCFVGTRMPGPALTTPLESRRRLATRHSPRLRASSCRPCSMTASSRR